LLLGPPAVAVVWQLGARLAGSRFGSVAAWVYVVLPVLAAAAMLGSYRSTFAHEALPAIVGLQATGWLALGILGGLVVMLPLAGPVVALCGLAVLLASWHDLGTIRLGLHETAWSIAMFEWLALAGIVGAARRSRLRAAGLGGWLALVVGVAARRGYDDAAFWQTLAAAAPAIAVLLSSLWLLVPPLRPAPAPTEAR
jgi:hypothetical protein